MRRIIAMAALLSLASALPSHADTKKASYIAGPVGDVDGPCANGPIDPLGNETGVSNPTPLNIGSVCFAPLTGFTRVSVTVADAAGWKVAFWAGFTQSNGKSLGGRWYCASASGIPIVTGARRMVIYIAGALGADNCINDVGVGTNGTVTAVFS